MMVIGVFRDFFANFGGVLDFINESHTLVLGNGSITFTPLAFVGAGLGTLLGIVLSLHIIHLINVIAG